MKFLPFTRDWVPAAKKFTDRAIGDGYYTEEQLHQIVENSQVNGQSCSLLLVDDKNDVFGVRITLPPGKWHLKDNIVGRIHPEKWRTKLEETGYFQSLFIDDSLQGQGWGSKLSLKAMEILKQNGIKAVATHSWKESPGNSSAKYLLKLGFQEVAEHPLFWYPIDYSCTRCGKPCVCTATEMIRYL